MFNKAILMFSMGFLAPSLFRICSNLAVLDLGYVNAIGLVVGASSAVVVSAGLIIYFDKRNALSKTLWIALTTGLLVLALTGTAFAITGSEVSVAMSPTELQNSLMGTAGYSIFQLADGSFILNTANDSCTFLVKLDSSYDNLWTKTIRVSQETTILSRLAALSDGGFALAGVVNNRYVLMKTDSRGDIQWTSTFNSGAPINYLRAIIQTRDGGFALAGFGETVEEGLGWIYFVKTDLSGNMQWDKTFAGPVADCPSAIVQTSDGGYVMSDVSYSFVPDQGFFRLIKMDTFGNVLWNTTYGGEGDYLKPECNFAIATKDDGYLMAGYLWDTSAWVVKTDKEGNMQWNQTYGAKGSSITGALEAEGGGYLLASISNRSNAGLIMTDKTGNDLWNTTFTGVTLPIGYEANFNSLVHAKNGDYIMVGSKNQSVWLAKVNYQNNLPTILQPLSIANAALAMALVMTLLITLKKKKKTAGNQPTQNKYVLGSGQNADFARRFLGYPNLKVPCSMKFMQCHKSSPSLSSKL